MGKIGSQDIHKIDIENVEDIYPLTPIQQGILYHSLQNQNIYNECVVLELEGNIEREIFEHAWQTVMNENSCLRTVFRWEAIEKPVQIVLKKVPVDIEYYDDYNLEIHNRFDLREISFKIVLIKNSNNNYTMQMWNHHILFDGWSTGIIIRQFFEAFHGKNIIELEKRKEQHNNFKEYILSQRETDHKFWASYLEGVASGNFLPQQSAPKREQTERKEELAFHINKDKVDQFTSSLGIPVSALINTCWAILYHKHLNINDIVFGTTLSTRTVNQSSTATGLFINTLPFRLKIDYEETLVEILERAVRCAHCRLDVQDDNLINIKKIIELEDGNEIFDSIVVIENYPISEIKGKDYDQIKINGIKSLEKNNYPLCLGVEIDKFNYKFIIDYDEHKFSLDYVSSLMNHFIVIVNEVIENSSKQVCDITWIDKKELHLINSFSHNRFHQELEVSDSIMDIFEGIVKRYPQNIAVRYKGEKITYKELNDRSNHLVAVLMEDFKGVDIAPVLFEKSIDFMIALLALMKIGVGFLPINHTDPDIRIQAILGRIKTSYKMLVSERFKERVAVDIGIDSEDIHTMSENLTASKNIVSSIPIKSNQELAYLICTSGTTGVPKLIKISNKNVVSYIQNYYSVISVDHQDVFAGIPPISFDTFYEIMFSSLLCGGTLELPEDSVVHDTLRLNKYILDERITVVNCTPLVLNEINKFQPSPYVRIYISGGDMLLYKHINNLLHSSQVYNIYGPAETTMGSTYFEVIGSEICIGYPFPSDTVYILDSKMKSVSIGTVGEIYIGGSCVAQGYLDDEETSKAHFCVYNNERVYKTGDIGKWDQEGRIHFLGRMDNQVKIRGFRVELLEIDKVISGFKGVEDAVSIVIKNDDKNQIVSYYTADVTLNKDELFRYLKSSLPNYMIPLKLYQIDVIQRNSNGKVVTSELPVYEYDRQDIFERANNEVEHKLLDLWSRLLNISYHKISINDNFFELGGDSIIGMQIAYKSAELGISLEINDVFNYPTIKQLALKVKEQSSETHQEYSIDGSQDLAPIQKSLFAEVGTKYNHWAQSILLKTNRGLDQNIVVTATNKILENIKELNVIFTGERNIWSWEYSDHHSSKIQSVELNGAAQEDHLNEIKEYANECYKKLDIENGPLYYGCCFAHKGEAKYLLLVAHHLIVDAYSWRMISDDIDKKIEKEDVIHRSTSYHEWVEFLNQWSNTNKMEDEYSHWFHYLLENEYKKLYVDHNLGENIEATSHKMTKKLSEDFHKKLIDYARSNSLDSKFALYTIILIGLKQYFQTSHLLHFEGHGREAADLEFKKSITETIGWFTSIFPYVNDLDITRDFTDLAMEIQNHFRNIPYNGAGYYLAKYNKDDNNKLFFLDQSEILVSYLGVLDNFKLSNFELLSVSVGDQHDSRAKRQYLIEIDFYIHNESLYIDLKYSSNHFREESIMDLIESFTTATHLITFENEKSVEHRQYMLSPVQESMLFHMMYSEENSVGLEQSILEIRDDCNIKDLETAWNSVLNSHDALRASFHQRDNGDWYQVISREQNFNFHYESYTSTEEDTVNELRKIANKELSQGLDISQSPAMRIIIVSIHSKQYFVWTYHHLLLDGWCLYPIVNQLNENYFAIQFGHPLKEYTSTMNLYNDALINMDHERIKEFWIKYFKDFNKEPLLTELLPPIILDSQKKYKELKHVVPSQLYTKIKSSVKTMKITFSTLVQGAWSILLYTYTGSQDVVFGVTSAGRPANIPEIDKLIGCFMNTLPLRVRFDTSLEIDEYLRQLQSNYSQIRNYDITSLSTIVECSKVDRNSGLYDLYDSIVIVENYKLIFDEQQIFKDNISIYEETGYPLTLYCNVFSSLDFKLIYDSEILNDDMANRIMEDFNRILFWLVDYSNYKVSWIMEKITRDHIVEGEGLNVSRYDHYYDLFDSNLDQNKRKVAVACGDQIINYEELSIRSSRLAFALSKASSSRSVIPIVLNRSTDMIVSLLAVLQADYGFTLIDDTYPDDYIQDILDDIKAEVIITSSKNKSKAWARSVGSIIFPVMNNEEIEINHEVIRNTSQDIAYLVYTSGSTGKSKGIIVSHKSVIAHVMDCIGHYQLEDHDNVLQFSSVSFDISLEQILTSLIAKSTLVIRQDDLWTPYELSQEIIKNSVTVMNLPTAYWHQVVNDWVVNNIVPNQSLRLVIVGGEAMSPSIVRSFIETFPNIQLLNAYGPAETVMTSTLYPIEPGFNSLEYTPVGYPLANRSISIQRNGIKLPREIIGEVVFSGSTMSSGYWDNKKLTDQLFRFHDGITTYHSGDIGRILSDGALEVIGRNDNQVKIRSHRIEIGEVESKLMQTSQLKEVAVVVHEQGRRNKILVAFYVIKEDERFEVEMIKEYLPHYMIPSYFFELEKMPHNRNNKIDRKYLEAICEDRINTKTISARAAKLTDKQEKLLIMWRNVLGVQVINMNDSFFALGGNSLLAMKLITSIKKEFNLDIPISYIFKNNTFIDMSQLFDERLHQEQHFMESENSIYELKYNGSHYFDKDKYESHTFIMNLESSREELIRSKIIPVLPFNEVLYQNCFYNAIFAAFNYFKVDINYILCNEVSLYLLEGNTLKLKYHGFYSLIDVLEECNMTINAYEKIGTYEEFESFMIESLTNERIVVVQVDCFYEAIREDTYEEIHWPHFILVNGYDLDRKTFTVLEHSDVFALDYKEQDIPGANLYDSYLGYINNFGSDSEDPSIFNLTWNGTESIKDVSNPLEVYKSNCIQNLDRLRRSLDALNEFSKIVNVNYLIDKLNEFEMIIKDLLIASNAQMYRMTQIAPLDDCLIQLKESNKTIHSLYRIILKVRFSQNTSIERMEKILTLFLEFVTCEMQYYNQLLE